MEMQQDSKVYVAVGKDVHEGLATLGWAFRASWSTSQPDVSFVVLLHVNDEYNSKDLVSTPIGKLPASVVSNEMVKAFRAVEQERVDELLSKYMDFCSKVKAKFIKVEGSEQSIHQVIVKLISSFGITKLVVAATLWRQKIGSSYVHKHKPRFCELLVVSRGKLVSIKEENTNNSNQPQSKERGGGFRGWLGKMLSDPAHQSATNQGSSPHTDLPEDQDEDMESYIESLLNADAQVENDATMLGLMDQSELQLTDLDVISSQSPLSRNETLKAKLEKARKLAEEMKSKAKADLERRTKAERAASLFNARTAETEAHLKEEASKQVLLLEEQNTVREALREVATNMADSESRMKISVSQREGELAEKLRACLSETARVEAQLKATARARAEMPREMEELRRKRDMLCRRNEYWRGREAAGELRSSGFREFSEEEVRVATEGFSEGLVIAGAVGSEEVIYKGTMNHVSVAIQFRNEFCMQPEEKFMAQVELLRQIRHPNVVPMIGACMGRKCIVFDYMHHGTLQDALSSGSPHLPWHARVRIAAEIASALGFLHSASAAHGRLNASHILLDRHLVAKLSGLRAPLSTDSRPDVMGLGTLVLQLLTMGRDSREAVEVGSGDGLMGIVDWSAGNWPAEIAVEFGHVGARCAVVGEGREGRIEMTISAAVEELERLKMRAEEMRSEGGEGVAVKEEERRNVPSAFICPIYQEVMRRPYVATDGFSYERDAIKEWLGGGHQTSPMTNLKLKNTNLTPNHTLGSLIDDWQCKAFR